MSVGRSEVYDKTGDDPGREGRQEGGGTGIEGRQQSLGSRVYQILQVLILCGKNWRRTGREEGGVHERQVWWNQEEEENEGRVARRTT